MKSTRESGHPGIQTCHLCGKVQCGQRLGRVKCCLCSRIFCLQQLQRKFGIIAVANDPCFKCPRCTGVCCCVCNCQRPPPHVHCKVYKVRQNKTKPSEHRLPAESVPSANEGNRSPSVPPMLEMSGAPGSQKDMFAPGSQKDMFVPKLELSSGPLRSAAPGTEVPQPKLETPVQPGVSETRSRGFQENTQQNTFDSVPRIPSLTTMDGFYSYPGHEESFNTFPSNWQDSSNTWPFGHTDIPGSKPWPFFTCSSKQRLAYTAKSHNFG